MSVTVQSVPVNDEHVDCTMCLIVELQSEFDVQLEQLRKLHIVCAL